MRDNTLNDALESATFIPEMLMNKREFLAASALGAAALPALGAANNTPAGPTLLTVTGAIGRGNRGPLDPVPDQMMKKQGLTFDRAYIFDHAALTALPATTIRPTVEYDGRSHTLRGPLLTEVLRTAGVQDASRVVLRAIDGYAAEMPLADARKYRFIVATEIDGKPLAIGGLGPTWAVFDADRFADVAAKPIAERFALCPWGMYHIEVL